MSGYVNNHWSFLNKLKMAEFQPSWRAQYRMSGCVFNHIARLVVLPLHDQDPSQTASQTPLMHITCTLNEE